MTEINDSLRAPEIAVRRTAALEKLPEENIDNTHPKLASYYVKFEHPAAPKCWSDHGYRVFTD